MVAGLALSAAAGVILGQAWTSSEGSWWWLGATTLLSATLMVLSAFYAKADPPAGMVGAAPPGAVRTEQERIQERWEIEPMLGEILVQDGVITSNELLEALARQGGTGLLLGEVLVDMRLISLDQLEEALGEQSAWRDARRFAHADNRGCLIVGKGLNPEH
jgi:hypothetical protein